MKASRRGFLGAIIGGAVAPYVAAMPPAGAVLAEVTIPADAMGPSGRVRVHLRTGLPTATWRKLNEGVRPTAADLEHYMRPRR